MGKRKRYTAEEKINILREVLEDGKSISQVAVQSITEFYSNDTWLGVYNSKGVILH